MKGLMTPPGGERTFNALMLMIGGVAVAVVVLTREDPRWALLVVSLFWLATGLGLWLRQRWADYACLLTAALLAAWSAYQLVVAGIGVWPILVLLGALYFTWESWKLIRQKFESAGEGENNSDEPMISLVLLLKEPRFLETNVLANILGSAWGMPMDGSKDDDENEDKGGYVVGESPLFIASNRRAVFMIHNRSEPYFDDLPGLLERVKEMRMRHILEQHTAWLSVDLLSPAQEGAARESLYPDIARSIAELGEAGCLALFQPATNRFIPWDASLTGKLRSNEPLSVFDECSQGPVVNIDGDDPRMIAAVAEARRRWPEFVTAFKSRTSTDDGFTVKAAVTRGDQTEFIWLEVIGLEPEFIHGHLANDPVALDGLKLGDQLEVPLADLNDWAYVVNGQEPVGLFTVRVIQEMREKAGKSGSE
jgi:uncharacterized protein YegJ (DUF2314 family)